MELLEELASRKGMAEDGARDKVGAKEEMVPLETRDGSALRKC